MSGDTQDRTTGFLTERLTDDLCNSVELASPIGRVPSASPRYPPGLGRARLYKTRTEPAESMA